MGDSIYFLSTNQKGINSEHPTHGSGVSGAVTEEPRPYGPGEIQMVTGVCLHRAKQAILLLFINCDCVYRSLL